MQDALAAHAAAKERRFDDMFDRTQDAVERASQAWMLQEKPAQRFQA